MSADIIFNKKQKSQILQLKYPSFFKPITRAFKYEYRIYGTKDTAINASTRETYCHTSTPAITGEGPLI